MKGGGAGGPALVLETFLQLRRSGFKLGVDEYLAGLALVSEQDTALPFARNLDELKQALKLIWCNSQSEQRQFDPVWDKACAAVEAANPVIFQDDDRKPLLPSSVEPTLPQRFGPEPVPPQLVSEQEPPPSVDVATQPMRAPFTPAEIDQPSELQSYWPVSRRSMSYSWRYLRRTVAAGPAEVLDVATTVQQTAQQGFYLEPVMQQRAHNRAQLLLFIDQNGSMTPLHQFTREIVETSLYESGLPEQQVTVCYFQNVPVDDVYQDIFLTQPIGLSTVLTACDSNMSVLIVSDAGAARGYRRLERIRATARFLMRLWRTTQLCAWLNPMPVERWEGSSAEMIANLVPMFQMDDDGLSNAIDVVRGLLLQPTQR
ncbi:MAG: VWA containing CoxE family protein [Cyanothece sp. SIO1E1]|nr:VWA containing CoxE family protein [Cyanothece sp. SIO1E1]